MTNFSTQENARKLIQQARAENSKKLSLVSAALDEIPDEVFDLEQLEELNLFNNNIREVPDRIRDLVHLKRLSLIRNPIRKVPDIPGLGLDWSTYVRRNDFSPQHVEEIWIEINENGNVESPNGLIRWRDLRHLPNLRWLYIGKIAITQNQRSPAPSRHLRDLINDIAVLGNLDTLVFFGVHLDVIPYGIRALKRLHTLEVVAAGVREIPDWIDELSELQKLDVSMNLLIDIPGSLANLNRLKVLDLSENSFARIPEAVFGLSQLEQLDLQVGWTTTDGDIKQIPAEILELPNLTRLEVGGQPIEVPPLEVVDKGIEAIRNYWRQQQEVGIDYLCEAKLIILGEAGAGKTTLAKKIKDPNYKLEPQESSTEGIDVVRWSFPAAVRVREEDGEENVRSSEFKASIWDFGGQEIYHATHQFFLTRRSLYVLVADDRKEDTDFNYWLQVVELLSDQSPLLIVQNEKQDRQRNLDLGTLRAHFPNLLRDAFRTNLATNRGLDGLTTAVRQELERLPHIGTPLPKTWSQVRTALESDPRNYISLDEYLAVCEANGFKRREDKLQLSGYLHDLGICLHFQDDPVLKNTVILKPKWGTDAVYAVLDDHKILDNRGRFGRRDLAYIWSDPAYADMHDELLHLMMRFKLCYPIPETDAYIAPQLLSPTRPAYEWSAQGGLVVRYQYDFMPKGILTRFIVALHHLIPDQDLVWKSGVILARDGTRAEVIEDYSRRKITARVSGPDTRGLLAIVDDQLERIHASFPRLKYDRFLPCNCEVCRTHEESFAYPLSELRDFAACGDMIQCRTSRKLVDASNLIRDVLPYVAQSLVSAERQITLARTEVPAAEPKEVFVSYAWTKESTEVVDKLQEALACNDITLLRDKDEVRYKDSIVSFMQRIGRGKAIVVILSKKYLESKNCMFELTEVAERGDVRDRVFPIILGDADIYDGISRVGYVRYWEQKKAELDAAIKGVSGENLEGIRDELDLYAHIRSTIAAITDILGDMNALSLNEHQSLNFSALIQKLQERVEA
ncbi:COR domain-containing protein [Longimicrobium sp.]|uniref:COR domain-containing protein n=1 Tax=Longimicrobium sp. TaxID=2029185 RepID=UPI003B3AEAE4